MGHITFIFHISKRMNISLHIYKIKNTYLPVINISIYWFTRKQFYCVSLKLIVLFKVLGSVLVSNCTTVCVHYLYYDLRQSST